jgi:drug/metabolite transporter (DMT)-like permease
LSFTRDADRQRPALSTLLMGVGAGASIALQLIALNAAPVDSGVAPLIAGRAVSATVLLLAALAVRGRLGQSRPSLPLAVTAGTLDSLANLLFLYAVRHGPLAVIAVIEALYPAGTLLMARIVLGERLTRPQLAGIGAAAVAVVLLAVP